MYVDAPLKRTYDLTGIKTVKMKTTGREKMRFTLVVTILSDGRKCRSMIIFKNLQKPPKPPKGTIWPANVFVSASKGGSMSEEQMYQWIKEVWKKKPGHLFQPTGQSNLLIMDSHRAHIKKSLLNNMKKFSHTDVSIVPAGMTPLLQPLDVSINRSIKAKWALKWKEWMAKSEEEFKRTKQKIKVSYTDIVTWISEIVDELDEESIKNSFKYCGISRNPNEINLHSRLNDIILTGQTTEDQYEPTGVTDDEDEEVEDDLAEVFDDDF